MIEINFEEKLEKFSDVVCLFVDEDKRISPSAKSINETAGGIITKFLDKSESFKGKIGNLKILSVTLSGNITNIVLVGVGKVSDLDEQKLENIGGHIGNALKSLSVEHATIESFSFGDADKSAALFASGVILSNYNFYKYYTNKKSEELPKLKSVTLSVHSKENSEKIFEYFKAVAEGIYLARDYVSEPPNVLYPESYANSVYQNLTKHGVEVEILCENEMKTLGMNALLGVGQGSMKESKLVIMKYNGLDDESRPIAFVGKGVTFDTGGISLKPSANMHDMKYDMAGSASVVGLMKSLAARQAKVNVVAVIGLVENMPGANAQRPGDVVKSLSGQTIEILNTDAEGRLVLADALWYTQREFNPEFMIDLATLTGAILVTFGNAYCGLFSNNDQLSEKLEKAGKSTGEKLWRLPIGEEFASMIKSDIADVANIGSPPGYAGSITAAQFLEMFVNNVPWAHLDIAGSAWEKKGKPTCPKGAVGYGVKLLDKFVKDNYEKI